LTNKTAKCPNHTAMDHLDSH